MQIANKRTILLLAILGVSTLLSGCINWEKKYKGLLSEHRNLKGRLAAEQQEKGSYAEKLAESERMIADLQSKISKQGPGGTGFDPKFNPTLDPSAGTITVTLPNAILFRSGSATLKTAKNADLDQILSVIRSEYRGRPIDVVGHTDSDPIKKSAWKDNWELSAQRALSVVRYLEKRGISGNKIRAVGCGAARSVASNSSASGKAKNRRVEIVVHLK
ncbi:MAG: OmpA/MotB family protein [Planctomycetota bacterium]|jgi:chemotaxis protein MotB